MIKTDPKGFYSMELKLQTQSIIIECRPSRLKEAGLTSWLESIVLGKNYGYEKEIKWNCDPIWGMQNIESSPKYLEALG